MCASEDSLQDNKKHQCHERLIDSYLNQFNQVRVPVPSDGHCIVRAFYTVLKRDDSCEISHYRELLQAACDEITENVSFYSDNITSDANIVQELHEYQRDKKYSQEIVDLVLYALANCTQSSVSIVYVHDNCIKQFEITPGREGVVSQRSVTLARIGEHYEAVTTSRHCTTQIHESPVKNDIPVIVISDSDSTPKKTKLKFRNSDVVKEMILEDTSVTSQSSVKMDDEVIVLSDSDQKPKKFKPSTESEDSGDSRADTHSSDDSSSDSFLNHPLDMGSVTRSVPTKLTPDVWTEIPTLKRNALPHDIDGQVVYELPFDPEDRMASSKDGRKWKRYMPSARSGFKGIRRLARCAGSFKCTNSLCNFRKKWGPNVTHFNKNDQCKFCGMDGEFVPCSASKVWEFNDDRQTVKVYHHGLHTCPVIVKANSKAAADALKKKFDADPEMKPKKAVNSVITEAIKDGHDWDAIESLAESLLDPSLPKNVKQKVRKELHPAGHSFEAVQVLKTKLDMKDPLYVFDMNDGRFNSDKPTFVFSTSKEKMNLAADMSRDGDLPFSREYCHFDGKHGRVHGMKTLTAGVFHPVLGKTVRLAVMHCEYENATNVALFWHLFNKALQAAANNPNVTFKPHGYMMDEGGAEWAGLERECGKEEVQLAKSCQFHFKQAVNREAGKLQSSRSKHEFKKLANAMLTANSPSAYDKAYGNMVKFVKEKPVKRGYLKSWMDWWDERKHHVFNAFRTLPFTPTTNLSECLHSSWETTSSSKLTLIDALYDDVADSVKFASYEKLLGDGSLAPPTGLSEPVREARERERQRRKAESYGEELVDSAGGTPVLHQEAMEADPFKVDPNCTHRHDKRAKSGNGKKRRASSKSAYEGSASSPSSLSQSSSEESDTEQAVGEGAKSSARGGRYRKNRSKQFIRNLEKAKTQRTRISVVSFENVSECHRKYTVTSAQVQDHSVAYEVNICTKPSCSCPEGLKLKQNVCKHILWIYMFVLGLADSCPLLQQVHLTTEEVTKMLKKTTSLSSEVQDSSEDRPSSRAGEQYLPASQACQKSLRDSNPFLLKYLESNVKVCAGCQYPNNTFRPNNTPLDPPYDIVVCHREIRQWKANGQIQRSPSLQNTYYHADEQCIQKNNPSFKKNMLVVPTGIKSTLKKEHKLYLREHFDLTV